MDDIKLDNETGNKQGENLQKDIQNLLNEKGPKPAPKAQKPAPKKPEVQNDMTANNLDSVYDVPVKVSAILGRSKIQVKDLVGLEAGSVIELDRKVGDAIDIYVNDRLVARGDVVMVEERLGVTMTEIFKSENN